MNALVVRRANTDDVEWILGELPEFSRQFDSRQPLLGNESYARKQLHLVVEHHLGFIAERRRSGAESVRVGFIVGLVQPHMFNPEIRTLIEMMWWVRPEHRRGRAGLLLLDAFVEWGKKNVHWMTFGLGAKSPVKHSKLTQRGFHLVEHAFLMEMP